MWPNRCRAKRSDGVNLVRQVLLRLFTQPLDRMVGEQEACVVSLRPVGAMAIADGVKLSCIQVQPALEIPSCQIRRYPLFNPTMPKLKPSGSNEAEQSPG